MRKKADKSKPRGKRTTAKKVQESEGLPPPKVPDVEVKPEADEDPWGEDGLTIRQRSFVEALVGPAGGNAARAAEMAGYASDNRIALQATAGENLRKPQVQKAIGRALARRGMTPEWARERLAELAGASMANFLTVGDDGRAALDMKKAAEVGALGQIKEYYEEGVESGVGGPAIIKRKIKLHDPSAALANVLKLHGLLIERREITGRDGGPVEHEHSVAPKFDHDRFAELYRRSRGTRRPGGPEATPDSN